MSKDGGRAFACASDHGFQEGMTLRDYFAGQALVGLLGFHGIRKESIPSLAPAAYELADHMLTAREPGDLS